MRELLHMLVCRLVDDPESVVVDEHPGPGSLAYSITVGPGDAGKVIGKQGRIINALRSVVKAAAVRDGLHVSIELLG